MRFFVGLLCLWGMIAVTSFPILAQENTLQLCRDSIERIAWSPNGELLAAQGVRGVQLYNHDLDLIARLEELRAAIIFSGSHGGSVDEYSTCWGKGIAWKPDSTQLVIPSMKEDSNSRLLKIWDVETGQTVILLHAPLPSIIGMTPLR